MKASRLVLFVAVAALGGFGAGKDAHAADSAVLERIQVEPRAGSDYFKVRFLVAYELASLPEAIFELQVQGVDSSIVPVDRHRVLRGRAKQEFETELKRTSVELLKAKVMLKDPKRSPEGVVQVVTWHETGFGVPTIGRADRIEIATVETRPGKRPELMIVRVAAGYLLESREEASLLLYADVFDRPGIYELIAEERIVRGSSTVALLAEIVPNQDRSTISVKLELRRYPRPSDLGEAPDRVVLRNKALPPR